MNKDERNALQKKGFKVLRAQWFEQKKCWKVVFYSNAGGWPVLANTGEHETQQECEHYIEQLAIITPDKYIKES